MIEKNYYLHQSAREAYRSYLLAYASHAHKSAFDVNKLDLQRVVKAFGFNVPPRVNLGKTTGKLKSILRIAVTSRQTVLHVTCSVVPQLHSVFEKLVHL